MSGFVCVLDRSRADVTRQCLARLVVPLARYGDTVSEVCNGPIGIIVCHSAGRTSTVNGSKAVVTESGNLGVAAVCGRIDVARHSCDQADWIPATGSPISPSRALSLFRDEGIGFLARVSGSFTFIAADAGNASLTVARDHLGSQNVYYYLDRRWLIAASEPSAILRHAAVDDDLDEASIARFLGFRFSHTSATFFRDIKELPPAHWMCVTPEDCQIRRYWRFSVERGVKEKCEQSVPREFRRQLGQAVAAHVEGLEPEQVALSLSGGLDSTSVAALCPAGVRFYSWFFDQTRDGDERHSIEQVAQHLGRPVHWVSGDGRYPLSGDFIESFVHENSPYINAFAALKRGLYQTAREAGCRRILVGDAGDLLFAARDYWLRDVLTGLQPGAANSLVYAVRRAARGDALARLALRRLLPVRHIRSTFSPVRIPWLTGHGHRVLPGNRLTPILPRGPAKYRFDPAVGAKYVELESEERRLFAQCGVERANPFWHWPLLETVLNLPAWWLHRDDQSKVLTREAMKGLLPDPVRNGPRIGLLGTFFLRGIESNQAFIRDALFRQPRSDWQRYVKRDWLEPYASATDTIAFGHTILWRVLCYELWYRRLAR